VPPNATEKANNNKFLNQNSEALPPSMNVKKTGNVIILTQNARGGRGKPETGVYWRKDGSGIKKGRLHA
jgi:hypothetical protein